MSLTNDQLEERIVAIENKLNEMQEAINQLATRKQVIQLTNVRQREVIQLQEQVADLESQVAALQTFHT